VILVRNSFRNAVIILSKFSIQEISGKMNAVTDYSNGHQSFSYKRIP